MAEPNFICISGIINPLFDGLTYNRSGHFAHCSYSSTLAKYPRVLYVKTSNKVYVQRESVA